MPDHFVPSRPDEITPGWLTRVLRSAGVLDLGEVIVGVYSEDPGSASSYAGQIARLTLTYNRRVDQAPETLIAKFPAGEFVIRHLFRPIYRAESRFYRELADKVSINVPICYAALSDKRETRNVLLLEDLGATATPGDHERGCTDEQANLALSRLGTFHARFWNSRELEGFDWLNTYGTAPTKNWLIYAAAWLPFQRRLRQVTPPKTRWLVSNLWRYRSRLAELAESRPFSLQHGDFRLANLAFAESDIYAFDWQVVRIGLPQFDLAWFMITSLTVEQRRAIESELLDTYHRALTEAGARDYSMDALVHDYRLGLLLSVPQIMVIGAFLRFNDQRRKTLGLLLERYEALAEDHDLEGLIEGKE